MAGGPGSVPVVVSPPNDWPPSVTPEVELTLGADRVSIEPGAEAPATGRDTSCSALGSWLISVTRITPVASWVAQILTGPLGALTLSRWAPGGKAWANIISP